MQFFFLILATDKFNQDETLNLFTCRFYRLCLVNLGVTQKKMGTLTMPFMFSPQYFLFNVARKVTSLKGKSMCMVFGSSDANDVPVRTDTSGSV